MPRKSHAWQSLSKELSRFVGIQEQNKGVSAANQQASESRIRNLDMAREVSATTREQILNQSSTAMLTQANQVPQKNVQDLLR